MSSFSAPQAAPHALYELKSLLIATQHSSLSSSDGLAVEQEHEYEIDIDREIACLALLSGLAEDATHRPGQVQAFVAWIAAICADTADCGGGRAEMSKAAAVASRRHSRPWRNLACLLARRCASLTSRYGVEEENGASGEVIRWLFTELPAPHSRDLH